MPVEVYHNFLRLIKIGFLSHLISICMFILASYAKFLTNNLFIFTLAHFINKRVLLPCNLVGFRMEGSYSYKETFENEIILTFERANIENVRKSANIL